MMDGCRSILVCVASGVPQGSALGPLLFLDNKVISYADDSTLMAVVTSPGVRVTVAEPLILNIVRVSE